MWFVCGTCVDTVVHMCRNPSSQVHFMTPFHHFEATRTPRLSASTEMNRREVCFQETVCVRVIRQLCLCVSCVNVMFVCLVVNSLGYRFLNRLGIFYGTPHAGTRRGRSELGVRRTIVCAAFRFCPQRPIWELTSEKKRNFRCIRSAPWGYGKKWITSFIVRILSFGCETYMLRLCHPYFTHLLYNRPLGAQKYDSPRVAPRGFLC